MSLTAYVADVFGSYRSGQITWSYREGFSNFVEYERPYGAEPQSEMTPFAPILEYRTRREKIEGVARLLISNIVDVHDPLQIAHGQIARRAEAMLV
jgi:hypothetical protein